MLVSHRKRFIFIKTAKTAGTSVESYFEKYCLPEGVWKPAEYRDQYFSDYGIIGGRGPNPSRVAYPIGDYLYNHMTAGEIKAVIPAEQWDSYFKFSVVRNPFDRLVSRYFFNKKAKDKIDLGTWETEAIIKDFRFFAKQDVYSILNYVMVENQLAVDFLIRYEHLLQDISYVCKKLNVDFSPLQFPRYKTNFRKLNLPVHLLYDDETRKFVEENYALELDFFSY